MYCKSAQQTSTSVAQNLKMNYRVAIQNLESLRSLPEKRIFSLDQYGPLYWVIFECCQNRCVIQSLPLNTKYCILRVKRKLWINPSFTAGSVLFWLSLALWPMGVTWPEWSSLSPTPSWPRIGMSTTLGNSTAQIYTRWPEFQAKKSMKHPYKILT